jgi:hypothetical protein
MSKFLRWSWWLVLIVLVGCAQLVAPGGKPVPTASPQVSPLVSPLTSPIAVPANDVVIQVHRTGGIAGTNDTWLIYGDGRIEYSGVGSSQSKQLAPDQMNTLNAAVRDVMAMPGAYTAKNACCDRFVYDVTIMSDGQTKIVHTVDAAPDEPPPVTNLLAAIMSAVK